MTRRKKRILRGAAVSLYPLGIQLSIADVATTTSVDQQKTTVSGRPKVVRKMPRLFLPHDEIVDCVVTEIINIHTVRSAVVFRVARLQPSFPSEEPILKLIDAFPGVEMTYAECLQSRSLINVYLQGS